MPIAFIVLAVSPWAVAMQTTGSPRDLTTQIESAVEEMASGSSATRGARQREVLAISPEQVIPVVVAALRDKPTFRDDKVRLEAYTIFQFQHAEKNPLGLEQILVGMNEPNRKIQAKCVEALVNLGADQPPEVIAALDKLWSEVDVLSTNEQWTDQQAYAEFSLRAELIRAISRRGALTMPYWEQMKDIFTNHAFNRSLRGAVRGAAADALIRIGGIEQAMEHFQDLDPVGERNVLGSFIRLVRDSQGTFNTDAEHRNQIRRLVLKAMRSEEADTRKAAVEAIGVTFGLEALFIRSGDDYELNPEVKSALQQMASHDSEEYLRQTADVMLKDGHQLFLNELRRRDDEARKKKVNEKGTSPP